MTGRPLLQGIHHAALICSDYRVSRQFYVETLGLCVIAEVFQPARESWKLDLRLPDGSQIELFYIPGAPQRPSYPEACGLRHLAFKVENLQPWVEHLARNNVPTEDIRWDPGTGKRFLFFKDPDDLPLELYDQPSHPGG